MPAIGLVIIVAAFAEDRTRLRLRINVRANVRYPTVTLHRAALQAI